MMMIMYFLLFSYFLVIIIAINLISSSDSLKHYTRKVIIFYNFISSDQNAYILMFYEFLNYTISLFKCFKNLIN